MIGQSRWFTRHCIAYGVPFQLHASDEALLASMLSVAPFGTAIVETSSVEAQKFTLFAPENQSPFQLRTSALETFEGWELVPLLQRLEGELMLHVGMQAPDRIFLHAGVVGWQGRAMLFPGFSCAGKTTLVAELVKLGATYYSDDYALLDATGMVHPYARDLHMRQPGRSGQKRVTVDDLGGRAATKPIPVGEIAFTEFMHGARWAPEPLTPGLAVLEMLRHAIPARQRPGQVLATFGKVMRRAKAFRSKRGEAKIMAESLLNTLDSGWTPA